MPPKGKKAQRQATSPLPSLTPSPVSSPAPRSSSHPAANIPLFFNTPTPSPAPPSRPATPAEPSRPANYLHRGEAQNSHEVSDFPSPIVSPQAGEKRSRTSTPTVPRTVSVNPD